MAAVKKESSPGPGAQGLVQDLRDTPQFLPVLLVLLVLPVLLVLLALLVLTY